MYIIVSVVRIHLHNLKQIKAILNWNTIKTRFMSFLKYYVLNSILNIFMIFPIINTVFQMMDNNSENKVNECAI